MLRPFSRQAVLRLVTYAVACLIPGVALWLERTFGDVSPDQLVWHVLYADPEAVRLGAVFWVEFMVEALVLPLAVAVLAASAHSLVAARLSGTPRLLLRGVPMACCAAGVAAVGLQFSVFSYAASYWGPDRFAQSYVDPAQARLVAGAPRNLVVIYVESLEATYGREETFGRDLLAPLRDFAGYSFPGYRGLDGMNWTMEALVSTQCGIPLKAHMTKVRRRPDSKTFLPGATCLGDVLQAQGYHTVFMGGASLDFSGKGSFLRDHGFAEVWGREEWQAAGVRGVDMNVWGLGDDELLARARQRLAQLHAAGQPFNLTILTVDTHHPKGHLSRTCRNAGGEGFEDILGCTVNEVASFLRFAQEQGYLRNTAIVVIGDHLAPENPLLDKLRSAPDRRIFNLVLGKDLPQPHTRDIVAFDLFPTLLELAGTEVAGGRLGLGYSAVGTARATRPAGWIDTWSLSEIAGSARYDALWAADEPVHAGRLD